MGSEKKIKSYSEHYYDKDIDYNISYSGSDIVLNEFVSQYLRSTKADSIVTIFNIKDELIDKIELVCKECINLQVQNDRLYYGKKFYYFPGTDAYDWKIYQAPKFDLSKSKLLAEYIEILLVSPDGKYILGKKYLHGKDVAVILDTETKKFDYILGRDYLKYKYFFSPAYTLFAFDAGDYIIYIDYPEEFPFNAIGDDAKRKRTTKEDNTKFWERYKHPEL